MSTEEPKAEPTPEQIEAEAEKAFAAGFAKKAGDDTPDYGAEPAPVVAVVEEPAPKAEPEPVKPTEPSDPYAGLPEGVREALAAIPKLEHIAASANGRYAALQRQFDELKQTVTAKAPAVIAEPQKSKSREAVERELPEVAELLDEVQKQVKDQLAQHAPVVATPAAPKDERSEDERLLDEEQPDWRGKFAGTDFNVWLASQPAEYRARVTSTDKAAIVMAALGKFDLASATRAQAKPDPVIAQRQARAAAAVVPTSSARPAQRSNTQMTDEEAFAAGFNRAARRTA